MRGLVSAVVFISLWPAAPLRAQEPHTQPTSRVAPSSQQRQNDLLAIIEGQNSPEARRTAARELLLQGWPETPNRLLSILNGPNGPARVAVAAALTDLPQFLEGAYADALVALLDDADPETRSAAAGALAASPPERVLPRVHPLAADAERPVVARLAAISVLGLVNSRDALETLVGLLRDPAPTVVDAALQSLEESTAMEFSGDPAAAQRWWESTREMPLEEWQRGQIERLARRDRAAARKLQALEARLVRSLRESYLRAPETERPALVLSMLGDGNDAVRRLGLDTVRAQIQDGKAPPPEIAAAVRALLGDSESTVRAAAVRTIATLREPGDAERLLEMLTAGDTREVRQAIVSALGYVGGASVAAAVLRIIEQGDESCLREAAGAIGRLAERRVLSGAQLDAAGAALEQAYARTARSDASLRERLLWAMGLIRNPRHVALLVAALDPAEPTLIRQAAASAIASTDDPKLADAIAGAVSDVDAGVRKTVVEVLAKLATSDAHLQALWARLSPAQETDEAVRQAAWRGALRLLAGRPPETIERFAAQLPENMPDRALRRVELLQLIETALAADPARREALGLVRARIAAQQLAASQPAEAVQTYRRALEDLIAVRSEQAGRIRAELLVAALTNRVYDLEIAALVSGSEPDPAALWRMAKPEIEQRLKAQSADQALAMLESLERVHRHAFSTQIAEEVQELLQRARTPRSENGEAGTSPRAVAESQPARRGDE